MKIYSQRLAQLGIQEGNAVHSTRLKQKLLAHIPGLQAYWSDDSDAICLARAAQIVRRDMFNQLLFTFEGSFESNCQEKSVSTTLITLINMLLEGPNIADRPVRSEALTIAQLIRHNSVKHQRRKSSTITVIIELGISVSYDKVLQLSTDLSNIVSEHYRESQVIVPTSFRNGVFTTSAVDNIDHNPSSNTATDSFHGTAISLFQHPDFDGQGAGMNDLIITSGSSKSIKPLPDFYTCVPPVAKPSRDPTLPVGATMVPQIDREALSKKNMHG